MSLIFCTNGFWQLHASNNRIIVAGCGEWRVESMAYVMYYTDDVMNCAYWKMGWIRSLVRCVHHTFVQITKVLTKLFTQLKSIGNAIISHLVVTRPATNRNRFYSVFNIRYDMPQCPMLNMRVRFLYSNWPKKKKINLIFSSSLDIIKHWFLSQVNLQNLTQNKIISNITNIITVDALNYQSNHNNIIKHVQCIHWTMYNKHEAEAGQMRKREPDVRICDAFMMINLQQSTSTIDNISTIWPKLLNWILFEIQNGTEHIVKVNVECWIFRPDHPIRPTVKIFINVFMTENWKCTEKYDKIMSI